MQIILEFSREKPEMAIFEAEKVLGKLKEWGSYAISDTDRGFERLSYANRAHQLLFSCKAQDLADRINGYDWAKAIQGSFRVCSDRTLREKELAGLIWNRLKSPKVSLSDPETTISFLHSGEDVLAGKFLWENKKGFLQRKAHMRPRLHPSSLHPRLARACINMTGIKKGSLLDPFCGTGGILIEAAFLGFDAYGMDIDRQMVQRAEENLSHYGFKGTISHGDALRINGKYDSIVTDLPYGKNTTMFGDLYKEFFSTAYQLTRHAVIMIPAGINHQALLGPWKLERDFTYYLHKSLSKRILVLRH